MRSCPASRDTSDGRGVTITRTLKVPWEQRHAVRTALMGLADTIGGEVFITLPHADPNTLNATVHELGIAPFHEGHCFTDPADDTRLAYGWAQLTVTYRTPEPGDAAGSDSGDSGPAATEDWSRRPSS